MRCEELIGIFPEILRDIVIEMNVDISHIREIRVRADRPVLVMDGKREYISKQVLQGIQVSQILAYLGNYSLYAYEDEIRRGFLSLPGGHRVGLAGRTVLEAGRIKTMTEISSLNLRFAHEVKGCADGLEDYLWEKGRLCSTLIVSAPGGGKTTLLRDCIRQISDGWGMHRGLTVGVVDERSEIAGSFHGVPGNDVGIRTDVLDECPKAQGMMMLIRSMAPKVVAVDEIGGREDLEAILAAVHCGCVMLATVHGNSMAELLKKPVLREIVEAEIFERYIILKTEEENKRLLEVLDDRGGVLCSRC